MEIWLTWDYERLLELQDIMKALEIMELWETATVYKATRATRDLIVNDTYLYATWETTKYQNLKDYDKL